MKVTVIQGEDNRPIVSVQSDSPGDSPEDVAKTYLKVQEILNKKEETK